MLEKPRFSPQEGGGGGGPPKKKGFPLAALLRTSFDPAMLLARLALALVIFPHGAQKALGAFGGPGLKGTIDYFAAKFGISMPLTLCAIAAEFLGAIALAVGFFGRVAALGIGITMAVAMKMHIPNGFFMDWQNQHVGEGYEFHILALGLAAAIVIRGSGALSLDHVLTRKK
jgi:putative oxidoreductase